MKDFIISGFQQIGIGVSNVSEAFKWYREQFGMDIKVFEEAALAEHMLPYTGNKPQKRHAILALNIQGGGGFEIWQYTERTPQAPAFKPQLGDLGIFACKMKSYDIISSHNRLKSNGQKVSELTYDPSGKQSFFVTDPYSNIFQFVECHEKFTNDNKDNGGVHGAIIGVSDIDKALPVYAEILGFDRIEYDRKGTFDELNYVEGGKQHFRRVLLTNSSKRQGPFSKLFGDGEIELFQVIENPSKRKIYEGRFWGDLGFIQICFDIQGFNEIEKFCNSLNRPFTVNSLARLKTSFDMGEAAGHFAYIEDPDGTLIELVETHKLPILKKLGWYLDLTKREKGKALPNWIVKALRFSRVK